MENRLSKNGVNYLLLTSAIFGMFGVFATVLGKGLDSFVIVFYVNLIQFIIFGIIVLLRKEKLDFSIKTLGNIIVFGIVNLFPLLFFNLAMAKESIGNVLLIQNLSTIIFSIVFSQFYLKEKLNYITLGLIIIALLGIAIIYLPSQNPNILGLIFAALVGLFNGVANIFRRNLGVSNSPYFVSLFTSLIGLIIFGGLSRGTFVYSIQHLNATLILILIIYGLLNTLTSYLLIKGFSKVKFTIGNLVLLMEVVFGSVLGILFLNQGFQYLQLIGNLIIFVSLVLIRVVELENIFEN